MAAVYSKKFRKLFLFIAITFLLLSIRFFANMLLDPLEKPYNRAFTAKKDIQAVVVLSGGSMPGSANLPLDASAFKRLVYGLMIAKKSNLPLVFSGSQGRVKEDESFAVKKSLRQMQEFLGIKFPVSKSIENRFCVVFEDKSLDTYQNALFSKKLFEKNGIEHPKIYLVTSAYHMKRSKLLFKNAGFVVTPAATDFHINPCINYATFFPTLSAFNISYAAVHEYFGILKAVLLRGVKFE